jgi:hypothetical protein
VVLPRRALAGHGRDDERDQRGAYDDACLRA